jgi:3-oxoacyl-[acyl-carrier protein] reductase
MDEPQRHRALVTGASSGIGAATAVLLCDRGFDVWLTYATNSDGAREAATRCQAAGSDTHVSQLDLRDPASIDRLVAEVRDSWSWLNVLVNNAAICPYTDVASISIGEWDAVMETNARGPFLLTRGLLPVLLAASGDRSIVNVASVAAQMGAVTTGVHYAASKGAVLALTRSLARLLAPDGIRVNAVAPGMVVTPMTDGLTTSRQETAIGATPLGRSGLPAEVAQVVALLASPEAGFTTGATYDVNGGLRID